LPPKFEVMLGILIFDDMGLLRCVKTSPSWILSFKGCIFQSFFLLNKTNNVKKMIWVWSVFALIIWTSLKFSIKFKTRSHSLIFIPYKLISVELETNQHNALRGTHCQLLPCLSNPTFITSNIPARCSGLFNLNIKYYKIIKIHIDLIWNYKFTKLF
jgi:hypothetical protein